MKFKFFREKYTGIAFQKIYLNARIAVLNFIDRSIDI